MQSSDQELLIWWLHGQEADCNQDWLWYSNLYIYIYIYIYISLSTLSSSEHQFLYQQCLISANRGTYKTVLNIK